MIKVLFYLAASIYVYLVKATQNEPNARNKIRYINYCHLQNYDARRGKCFPIISYLILEATSITSYTYIRLYSNIFFIIYNIDSAIIKAITSRFLIIFAFTFPSTQQLTSLQLFTPSLSMRSLRAMFFKQCSMNRIKALTV